MLRQVSFALAWCAAGVTLLAQEQEAPLEVVAPPWLREHKFEHEAFTFVRVRYASGRGYRQVRGAGSRGAWTTDYPHADVSLSAEIARMTSLKVDPQGKVLKLTDKSLSDYPFIYVTEPGRMWLSEEEVQALRAYLLGGGFLMVDDFWGADEWENFNAQIRRVFPGRESVELPLEHPIFHCVFDLEKRPQIPSISTYLSGLTTERPDAFKADYRAIYDDDGRMMVFICHNTDLADGWERAGDDERFTREVSVPKAIPMGINAVFYALEQEKLRQAKQEE